MISNILKYFLLTLSFYGYPHIPIHLLYFIKWLYYDIPLPWSLLEYLDVHSHYPDHHLPYIQPISSSSLFFCE